MNTNDQEVSAVSALENNFIAANTKKQYASSNHHFILWLYNKRETMPNILRPAVIEEIKQAKESTTMNSKQKKKEIRRIVVDKWLGGMQMGMADLCPVDMTKITYNIAAQYIANKKSEEGNFLSVHNYSSIRSGIAFLFKMTNIPLPAGYRDQMSTLLKGLTRTIVAEKVDSGESLEEGKEAMSFACYELLCKKFFEGEKNEYAFAHLFLTLEWNLIARSDNIVNLSLSNIEWIDDAMLTFLKRTKTDQEGKNGKIGYHLYANPLKPHLDVLLSLGIYLFTNPGIVRDNRKLFPAKNQYNRYSQLLARVIKENAEEFARLGVTPGCIGTHSARKGAATLAASGCTIAPSMASICNRAGWKWSGRG